MPAKTVILSGFMATGKSSVGGLVASALGLPFVDTDAMLAEAAGVSVGELFAREGEARFREREAALVLPLLSDGVVRVIAFGGGTVTIPRVRHAALEAATVVTLTAAPDTVVTRALASGARPNLMSAAPLDRARDLLALRREAYGECHATIATEGQTPEGIAARIVEISALDGLAMPLGTRTYRVELAEDEPGRLAAAVRELSPSSLLVISDTNVMGARRGWIESALADAKMPRHDVVITPGEASKNLATISRIWDEALARGIDRDALVVALGGGVVGDLAGFAASTLLRGIRCLQIATSLLAMVDSSVGGKTGFDHATGKNLIGAFFQPSRVIVDVAHLETLPARERAAGLAEIVKIALIREEKLLETLERDAEALAAGERKALRPVIRAAIEAKIRVVREDERESGPRALLNLGHTVGHALEAHGGYATLLHGEAVAVGTVHELEATERLGLTAVGTAARAEALLQRLSLPTRAPRSDIEASWSYVLADKKRAARGMKLPVVTRAGSGAVVTVELAAFHAALLA